MASTAQDGEGRRVDGDDDCPLSLMLLLLVELIGMVVMDLRTRVEIRRWKIPM